MANVYNLITNTITLIGLYTRFDYSSAVHAYVLMTNHVHLLATPEDERSMGLTLQALGRVYVRYVNTTYRRSGTLWEGRYKSTVVGSEDYLLAVSRYIELNPVRAGMGGPCVGIPMVELYGQCSRSAKQFAGISFVIPTSG